jgi:histidinol phosphatase-like enzyme
MKQLSKVIAVDLDDTLCFRPKEVEHLGADKYKHCKPILGNIEYVNALYDNGHTIVIYTARGMFTYNFDVSKIYSNLYTPTLAHLDEWGVKFHQLIMGKYPYDYLLDDKAIELANINYFKKYIE